MDQKSQETYANLITSDVISQALKNINQSSGHEQRIIYDEPRLSLGFKMSNDRFAEKASSEIDVKSKRIGALSSLNAASAQNLRPNLPQNSKPTTQSKNSQTKALIQDNKKRFDTQSLRNETSSSYKLQTSQDSKNFLEHRKFKDPQPDTAVNRSNTSTHSQGSFFKIDDLLVKQQENFSNNQVDLAFKQQMLHHTKTQSSHQVPRNFKTSNSNPLSTIEPETQITQQNTQLQEQRNALQLITSAAVTIQKHTRGFITRLKINRVQEIAQELERAKLNEMLGMMQASVQECAGMRAQSKQLPSIKENFTAEKHEETIQKPKVSRIDTFTVPDASSHQIIDMEQAVNQWQDLDESKISKIPDSSRTVLSINRSTQQKMQSDSSKLYDDALNEIQNAVVKIQRQARVYLNWNRFRASLYKLILLKNIVETKIHKEKMQMLFAFEQLIINTEDPNPSGYDDEDEMTEEQERQELIKIKSQLDNEKDPYLKNQLMELYEQPMMLMGIKQQNMIEPEAFFENADDIINEEEFEESIINQSVQKHNSDEDLQAKKLSNFNQTRQKFLQPLKPPVKPQEKLKSAVKESAATITNEKKLSQNVFPSRSQSSNSLNKQQKNQPKSDAVKQVLPPVKPATATNSDRPPIPSKSILPQKLTEQKKQLSSAKPLGMPLIQKVVTAQDIKSFSRAQTAQTTQSRTILSQYKIDAKLDLFNSNHSEKHDETQTNISVEAPTNIQIPIYQKPHKKLPPVNLKPQIHTPETEVQPIKEKPTRSVDFERLNTLSKPVLPPESEVQPIKEKPIRPVDFERLNSLSKPRPKPAVEEPEVKPNLTRASKLTRQQLKQRAKRVFERQQAAFNQKKAQSTQGQPALLAITDGSTQGTVNQKETLKKLKARSAQFKRGSIQTKPSQSSQDIFDRLAQLAKPKPIKSQGKPMLNKPNSINAAPLPLTYYQSVMTNTLDVTQNDSLRSSQDLSLDGFNQKKPQIVTKVKQKNSEYVPGFTEKKQESDEEAIVTNQAKHATVDSDDDFLPFQRRISRTLKTQGKQRSQVISTVQQHEQPQAILPVESSENQVEIQVLKGENKDWLLDPVNLYLRGMAQRREQMKILQPKIQQEQRAEINRRITLQLNL